MLRGGACVLGLLLCGTVRAQCAPRWSSDNSGAVFNNEVRGFTEWNGGLVAVGTFTQVNGQSTQGVAFWDGESWTAVGPASGGGVSRANAVDYIGTLVVDGLVLSNGLWRPIGTGLAGTISALAVYDGALYAGGVFTSSIGSVARLNGTAWQPAGPLGGAVRNLVVHDGRLIACGAFPAVSPGHSPNIAQWDGVAWTGMGTVPMLSAPLRMGVADGDLFLSGYQGLQGWVSSFDEHGWHAEFTTTNMEPVGFVEYDGAVHVGASGTFLVRRAGVWSQSPPYLTAPGFATSFALAVHGGALFVGGYFTGASGVPATNLARYQVPSADFNRDGDVATDQDIEAFFACLQGSCCSTCASADIDADGVVGSGDIDFFFRVITGNC